MKTFACRQKQIKLIRRELNKTRIVFSSVRSLIVRSTLKKVKENLKLVSEIFDEYERGNLCFILFFLFFFMMYI